jgi:hypothetical protein
VVLKTVRINVAKVGENVSKKNMNPREEDKTSGTLVIQQLLKAPQSERTQGHLMNLC